MICNISFPKNAGESQYKGIAPPSADKKPLDWDWKSSGRYKWKECEAVAGELPLKLYPVATPINPFPACGNLSIGFLGHKKYQK